MKTPIPLETTMQKVLADLPRFGLNTGRPFPKPISVKEKHKKGLRRVSVKHQNELKEYNKIARRFLKKNPNCAVFPYLKATEIHHVRGRIGPLLTDTEYFMAVSRVGHLQIHNNVKWAKEKGYILNRFIK